MPIDRTMTVETHASLAGMFILGYTNSMTSRLPNPSMPQANLDPELESLATSYLSVRRGKPQWGGPPTLAKLTTRILPQSERSGGVGVAQLQTRWREIVGDKIATISSPDVIKGETLVVKVVAAAAPMMAMRADEIIGLVRLAGAVKVKKLTFVRAPLSKAGGNPKVATKRPLNALEQRALDQNLQRVESPDLKAALKRLADAISDID
jgi:hypothetical protein